jgi:uncharacterized protein (DUF488 family)
MGAARIFTVGHSNHPIERFLELLQTAQVQTLADVRSFPASRHAPQYNKDVLTAALLEHRIFYMYCGGELGGRGPKTSDAEWQQALERIVTESGRRPVALMCAERDPLDCHRLSLARTLAERGIAVAHILASGEIATQDEVEERLLARQGLADSDLFSRELRLADAYRARHARRLRAG